MTLGDNPMSERVRTTLTLDIDAEVLEVYRAMAATSKISLSRCVALWLEDTADGARFVAQRVEDARVAPMVVLRELHARMQGASEVLDETMSALREGARERRRAQPGGGSERSAPSSNTGLKGTEGHTSVEGKSGTPRRRRA